MNSRNVIISLVFVLGLIVIIFFKLRFEPRKKFTFNRNPSRIEYSQVALCRMDCQNISANVVTEVLRRGEVNNDRSDMRRRPCAIFTIHGKTKKGIGLTVVVAQCGTVARITNCYDDSGVMPCSCVDGIPPISFYKIKD